jgi:hypothetical protein
MGLLKGRRAVQSAASVRTADNIHWRGHGQLADAAAVTDWTQVRTRSNRGHGWDGRLP